MLLTRALDLDAVQQATLRNLLIVQATLIDEVWRDPSVPSAYRVGATRSISNHTADEIRAMLNDEQKKKYDPSRQPRPASSTAATLEAWMNATNSQQAP